MYSKSASSSIGGNLPADLSFLRSVDLGEIHPLVVEEDLHIIEKELMGIGVRNIESEMVDKLHLLLLPFCPAVFAHLFADLLPELGRNRRVTDRFALRTAACAFEFVTK